MIKDEANLLLQKVHGVSAMHLVETESKDWFQRVCEAHLPPRFPERSPYARHDDGTCIWASYL